MLGGAGWKDTSQSCGMVEDKRDTVTNGNGSGWQWVKAS